MERALATRQEKEYLEKIMPEMIDYCRWGDTTWGYSVPHYWVIYFKKKFHNFKIYFSTKHKMKTQTNEPMVKHSNQVHTTTDYFLFKPIDGNRNKNLLHINRLKKSMAENYLFTIIIVNENYEIIDGQHRFDVIQELNLPLNYVVCKGYGLNEVHILNQNSKNWTTADYLEGYCNLGYSQYVEFKKFIDKHEINTQIAMYLLSGADSGDMVKTFNSGQFKIKNLKEAETTMDKLHLCGAYFPQYKMRWFVFAMVRLFKKPQFEFTEFLQKLKTQPTALQVCNDVNQYVSLIEEIYNYRRRDKINLRY